MEISGRNPVVSMVRGIAIILVVIGHSLPSDNWVRNYIYMFHMPLFFFVSGYCFKEKYLGDGMTFVRHRLRGLWWPFVKYGVPMVLLHNVFCSLHIYGSLCNIAPYTPLQMGKAVLTQLVMNGAEPMLGAYWFLNTLLGASLLFYFCHRVVSSKLTLAILILGSAVCLLLMPYVGGMRIVFRICFAGTYMALGHVFASISYLKSKHSIHYILVIMFAVLVAVGEMFLPHEMIAVTLTTMLPSMLVALMGIIMLWGLCQWFITASNRLTTKLSNMLNFVGNNTLTILTWHFLCFKVVTLFLIQLYGLPIEQLELFPIHEELAAEGWWLLYSIAGISVVSICRK